MVSYLSGKATVGSKQRFLLFISWRNFQQSKRPLSDVLVAVLAEETAIAHPLAKKTRYCDHNNGISILPGGTSIKGKLTKIVRK